MAADPGAGPDPGPGPINLVAFRLGGRLLGVDIMQVHKVLTGDDPLVLAPGAPAHVLGMIELQGALVAVLDLARLLGLDGAGAAGSAPPGESGSGAVDERTR